MTDYKQLCAELVDELEGWIAYSDEIDIANAHVLIDRARAALTEPEPDGPTPQPVPVSEAAKLVAWLRKTSRAAFMDGWPNEESINLTRAADLLERLSPLSPINFYG